MTNLKNITDLPLAESADGLKIIVNDNGVAKQISADDVSGASSWHDITDKPFYEETVTVNEPVTITWDGNTDGLVSSSSVGKEAAASYAFYKVSDLVLTDEQIKSSTVFAVDGEFVPIAEAWDYLVSEGRVTEDFINVLEIGVVFVRKNEVVSYGDYFPEAGIYFVEDNGYYVRSLQVAESVEYVKIIRHPIETKYLPESLQFGTETVTVNEPLNITWDGNTNGLVNVNEIAYKVSDIVLTDEQIKLATIEITMNDNIQQIVLGDVWEDPEMQAGFVSSEEVTMALYILIARKDGATINADGITFVFPEKGIYFMANPDMYVSSLAITEPIEYTKTVVKTLDPKYLPNVGGVKYVTIGMDDEDNYTASATYADITDWLKSGKDVKCVYDKYIIPLVSSDAIGEISTYVASAPEHKFCMVRHDYGDLHCINVGITADNYVDFNENYITTSAER
jgi:hypothetical protein